ncbi:hypothetical protein ABE096_10005 [Robertmurraya massiliosenegalensis]|uniref:hypothetical protein n=1 Tax=Robertmurraya TaxID=2837507 RepID=UPI0039A5C74E
MISRELEFRGINHNHLRMYIEELGGKQINDEFPILFEGDNWKIEILREGELTFTSIFKINTVHIRFSALTEEDLENLIKQYRFKTTRVGG